MIVTINIIVAVVIFLGGILIARGYLPHLELGKKTATGYLTKGLALGALATFPRILVWDVLWRLDHTNTIDRFIGSAPINLACNLLLLWCVWYILQARLLSIPVPHRRKYNILTAPGYPDGMFKSFWK